MKCYTITKNAVREGIDKQLIPVTTELNKACKGDVTEASVVPVTPEREGIDFVEVFKKDLQAATAVCDILFDVPDPKIKTDRSLIAYCPRNWYPYKTKGDKSVIIYRSADVFISMGSPGEVVLKSTDTDKEVTLDKKGPSIKGPRAVFKEIPKEEEFFIAYLH